MSAIFIVAGAVLVAALAFAVAAFVARDDLENQVEALRTDLAECRRSIDALTETVEELRPHVPSERDARAIDALQARLQQLLNGDDLSEALSMPDASITDGELERLFAE